jgi:uncharacterized protein
MSSRIVRTNDIISNSIVHDYNSMFIVDKPAMLVDGILVISDLHLGITKDIWDKGIRLPSQVSSLAKKVNDLKKFTKAKKLVLLGDVKHNIPNISWQEYREVPEFFSLLKFRDIVIVKGNHDGLIEKLVPKNVKVVKTFVHGNYAFTHGHRKIETKKKIIVIGHNQPHVRFRDKMKAIYTEPVWVKGYLTGTYKGKKIIMVPAFNELAGATLINKDQMLGPIAKCLDKKKSHCYLLDGTDLGVINDLKVDD